MLYRPSSRHGCCGVCCYEPAHAESSDLQDVQQIQMQLEGAVRQLAEREATKMEIEVVRDYRRTRHEQERLDAQLNQLQQQIAQVGRARYGSLNCRWLSVLPLDCPKWTFNSTKRMKSYVARERLWQLTSLCSVCCAVQIGSRADLQKRHAELAQMRQDALQQSNQHQGSLNVVQQNMREAKQSLRNARYHQINERYRKQLVEVGICLAAAMDVGSGL